MQARHYDRHDYLNEKRAALETLHRLLTGASAVRGIWVSCALLTVSFLIMFIHDEEQKLNE